MKQPFCASVRKNRPLHTNPWRFVTRDQITIYRQQLNN
jgi:hypothetical protein